MTVPYYRNTGTKIGAFTIGELTRALDDSSAFFDGPASDSQKQQILEKMVEAAKNIITPLRKQGYVFTIGRSYSEGAVNHGQGNTFDLIPATKDPSDCYSLAVAAVDTGFADQVWIEASDEEGNFHVHVKASNSYNENPDQKTILDVKGASGTPGLSYMQRIIKSAGGHVK